MIPLFTHNCTVTLTRVGAIEPTEFCLNSLIIKTHTHKSAQENLTLMTKKKTHT